METAKKFIVISGLNIQDNNRGTAALGYGSISFLLEQGYLRKNQTLLNFCIYKNPLKKQNRKDINEYILVDGTKWNRKIIHVFFLEIFILKKLGMLLSFTRFGRFVKNTELVAAINGGDGFSDIYNTETFMSRLVDTQIAMSCGIPLIMLPQTLGPFGYEKNRYIAERILKYAKQIFVRDRKFSNDLDKLGIKYEQTRDLSYYMKPQPWEIDIKSNAIGINVSGLAWSNKFRSLSGQFFAYPALINRLINRLREAGHTIYLIPHSYNYQNPEENNDDLIACREAYSNLNDKSHVIVIDKDMTSPQVKYVISKMTFFVGTRMHANFAAIYTGVPVFGLAYSYKFQGAFDANGLDGSRQTIMINNMDDSEINKVINKIDLFINKLSDRSA